MEYIEWLNIWLNNYIKPSAKERTYIRYEQLIRTHIAPKIGDMGINDLTPIVLQSFVTELLSSGNDKTGKGLSANTVNAIISVLKNTPACFCVPYKRWNRIRFPMSFLFGWMRRN